MQKLNKPWLYAVLITAILVLTQAVFLLFPTDNANAQYDASIFTNTSPGSGSSIIRETNFPIHVVLSQAIDNDKYYVEFRIPGYGITTLNYISGTTYEATRDTTSITVNSVTFNYQLSDKTTNYQFAMTNDYTANVVSTAELPLQINIAPAENYSVSSTTPFTVDVTDPNGQPTTIVTNFKIIDPNNSAGVHTSFFTKGPPTITGNTAHYSFTLKDFVSLFPTLLTSMNNGNVYRLDVYAGRSTNQTTPTTGRNFNYYNPISTTQYPYDASIFTAMSPGSGSNIVRETSFPLHIVLSTAIDNGKYYVQFRIPTNGVTNLNYVSGTTYEATRDTTSLTGSTATFNYQLMDKTTGIQFAMTNDYTANVVSTAELPLQINIAPAENYSVSSTTPFTVDVTDPNGQPTTIVTNFKIIDPSNSAWLSTYTQHFTKTSVITGNTARYIFTLKEINTYIPPLLTSMNHQSSYKLEVYTGKGTIPTTSIIGRNFKYYNPVVQVPANNLSISFANLQTNYFNTATISLSAQVLNNNTAVSGATVSFYYKRTSDSNYTIKPGTYQNGYYYSTIPYSSDMIGSYQVYSTVNYNGSTANSSPAYFTITTYNITPPSTSSSSTTTTHTTNSQTVASTTNANVSTNNQVSQTTPVTQLSTAQTSGSSQSSTQTQNTTAPTPVPGTTQKPAASEALPAQPSSTQPVPANNTNSPLNTESNNKTIDAFCSKNGINDFDQCQKILNLDPRCIENKTLNQFDCDDYLAKINKCQLLKIPADKCVAALSLPLDCRDANIYDKDQCQIFLYNLALPAECSIAGAKTIDECNKILVNSFLPAECLNSGISTLTGCKDLYAKKQTQTDCGAAGISDPELCKTYLFEKYGFQEKITQKKLPDICINAGAKTESDCQQILVAQFLPSQCKEVGITKENDCQSFLEQISLPAECLANAKLTKNDCNNSMFEIYGPEICAQAGITDNTECRDYVFNKYINSIKCEGVDQWVCKYAVLNRYLGYIVGRQLMYDALREVYDARASSSVSAEELLETRAKKIVPTKDKSTMFKLIRSDEKILMSGENLKQTSPVILSIDTDGDGLTDDIEFGLGTDPKNTDTDNDGYSDGAEVKQGYNPLGSGKLMKVLAPIEQAIIQNQTLEQPVTDGTVNDKYKVEKVENISTDASSSKFLITGTGEPNTTIAVFIYSDLPMVSVAKVDENGNWHYELDQSLIDGKHEVYVTINDNTGKILSKSSALDFFIKEAKAVTPQDFIATASSQTSSQSESMINIYIGVAVALVLIGILIFLMILSIQRNKQNVRV